MRKKKKNFFWVGVGCFSFIFRLWEIHQQLLTLTQIPNVSVALTLAQFRLRPFP